MTPALGGRAEVRVLHWQTGQPESMPDDQVRHGLSDQIGSLQLELDAAGPVLSQEEYYPFGGTAVQVAHSSLEVKMQGGALLGSGARCNGTVLLRLPLLRTLAGVLVESGPGGFAGWAEPVPDGAQQSGALGRWKGISP